MDEKEIISRCQAGDKAAFPLLFANYRHLIECVVFRIIKDRDVAKDVIQETLIRIYKSIHAFNGKCKISSWIYRIAMNESLRAVGKTSGVKWESADLLDTVPSDEPHALKSLIDKENQSMVNTHINALQPDYKAALVMHYYANMSNEEIAQSLNLPLGTVNSRIARGRDALREKIKEAMQSCT